MLFKGCEKTLFLCVKLVGHSQGCLCCSVSRCDAFFFSVQTLSLQVQQANILMGVCVVVYCCVLQCVAVCCSVLRCFQCANTVTLSETCKRFQGCVRYSVLQCVAVCCSALNVQTLSLQVQQVNIFKGVCIAVCCSVSQYVAVYSIGYIQTLKANS